MVDDGTDDLEHRRAAWEKLGGGELVDCRAHHLAFNFSRWHSLYPPIQPTWGKLIRLLFSYKGLNASLDAIRVYQRESWGLVDGESCVVELSSMAANNLGVVRNRQALREQRIQYLQEKLHVHQPVFVVMYGTGYRPYWEQIALGPFDADGLRAVRGTLALTAPHPVAFGMKNSDWYRFGQLLRAKSIR
ncbi:MAG: hypothetical protein AB7O65_09775 [Candidatus Korobacteraceae bacterium]